jgi:ATP-dependent exoDNAse (exonuclease V) alpha subunit
VTNGTLGTIERLDHKTGQAVVTVGKRRVPLDLAELRALDHAYAVTSHRSQGLSRERVYVTVDTRHSEELVNRRQFYVSVSRAVQDARVYTDDRQAFARAVAREQGVTARCRSRK